MRLLHLVKLFSMIGVCILMMCTPVKAEITPALLQEWSRQPSNVQWDLFNQRTNIQVVDTLPWQSPNLYETWGYTTLNVQNGYVQSVNIVIKRGCEFALTHEVGHALSDAGGIPYWWAFRPEFIPIWQAERYNNVLMIQGVDDIREYFACAYDLYIRYPQLLKQANPLTWNYLQVVLKYT